MKGVKKLCCGLLLACSIMLGLSLNASSDVSAAQYLLSSIPLYDAHYIYGGVDIPFDGGWEIQVPNDSIPWSSESSWDWSKTKAPIRFFATKSGDNCVFQSDSNNTLRNLFATGHLYSDNGILSSRRYPIYFNSDSTIPSSYCMLPLPLSNFDSGSIQPSYFNYSYDVDNMNKYYNVKSLNPYTYEYSALVLIGSTTVNGTVYDSHGFDFTEVFGGLGADSNSNLISKVSYFRFSIGALFDIADDSISVSQGSHLDFNFSLLVGANDYLDLSNFDSSNARISWTGIRADNGNFASGSFSCSKSVERVDEFLANLDFSCSFDSPYDFYNGNLIGFNFVISHPSYLPIFDAQGGLSNFGIEGGNYSFEVITDYDDTPAGTIGAKNVGSNPTSAPGAPGPDSSPNYESSLASLFSALNFYNPFAPIFSMFSDNTSCVSIPIIAGMLHAESSTVCPWFDSTTRSIATPIIGLFSMMLVFGFAVRWLGGSSGNMFIDDDIKDTGGSSGISLRNKYRRWFK